MVRIGEYSPNFRGNNPAVGGAKSGIFGEYEERRKHYNEQRKLEYQQYLAQKALNTTSRSDTKETSQISTQNSIISCEIADCVRREVGTQTIDRKQQDASTNTDERISLIEDDNGRRTMEQVAMDGLSSLLKEKDNYGHHNLNSARVLYEQDLCEQKEKKRSIADWQVRREQQGKESRNRWLAKENRRELEIPRVKEKDIKELLEKDSSNINVLSQLGEVRRKMTTHQMKMEEALKKNKSLDKGV